MADQPAGLRRRRTRRSNHERGAVAVEFALVLPLLAMLLIGTITGGFAFNDHLALTNAIREGARFGATTPNATGWEDAVEARTLAIYFNNSSPLVADQLCVQLVDAAGTALQSSATTTCTAVAGPDMAGIVLGSDECVVKVWAAKPTTLNWVLHSTEITLGAESVSYYERTPCVATP